MNIFAFDDYRDLVEALLQEHFGRGGKVKLAELLNCQPGYVSQVLNKSKIHFSPESLIKIAKHFKLNLAEEDYLLTLLHAERAGSQELQKFYVGKIKKFKDEFLSVEKQVKETNLELDEAAKAIYYGHWAYSAIHMLVSIPGFQTLEDIATRLNLGFPFTTKVLQFLLDKGLISEGKGMKYSIGKTRIHLSKDSPHVKSHHQNWRHRAIMSLSEENDFDLHYSGVLTLSKKDAKKIRELILKLIADNEEILIPSANEEMVSLNIDYFKM